MENHKTLNTIALIVAAGRGKRVSSRIPKQYIDIGTEKVLTRSLRTFADHPRIDGVRAVIHPDDQKLYSDALGSLEILEPVFGGVERQDSVRLGLESLVTLNPQYVVIHDAARPFVSKNIIDSVLTEARPGVGCIPVIPVADTVKKTAEEFVQNTEERSNFCFVQTPQGFFYTDILAAHRSLKGHILTDDSAVAEQHGLAVKIVTGSPENYKLTVSEQLNWANNKIDQSPAETRVGNGFDVHRFTDGNFVMLCGVKIPSDRGLEGHSDADVGLHALTDALLGASGSGDIGHHFPATDKKWKDADSRVFLLHAAQIIKKQNARINNIDVTIICEQPKISMFRDQMQSYIANILELEPSRINIKGTTTETLGFLGRGEGVAAQAIASITFS